ncbi:hypothetical protein ACFV24_20570 [Nocardia fluminea]|uniref:hypothetical protein n=1 Tax=Nocardia fluminea TaxID=134984 RepID=UPI0036731B1E
MTVRITTGATVFAEARARTITGIAVTFGTVGAGSIGPTTFAPGSIELPADLTRVKLFRDHRDQYGIGTPVGWLTHAVARPDGLHCTFAIGTGPDGDQALADAQGVRDGLSIEISGKLDRSPDGTVRRAQLAAVALVPTPAFADARVLTVTYSETPEGAQIMTTENENPQVTAPAVTESAGGNPGPVTTVAPDAGAGVPATPGTTAPLPAPVTAPATEAPASAAFAASASRPVGVQVTDRAPSFAQVAGHLQAMMRGDAPSAAFALSDITSSAFTPEVSQPGWLGELWSGAEYQRVIVPLITSKPLTHHKMVGWRWTTKPQVGPWLGDKTEIPSNTPATEPVEVNALRLAAGWDFDRKFVDFNDNEFMSSFLAAAVEDYRFKSDQIAGNFVVANAAPVIGTAPDLLRAVARGNLAVYRGTKSNATFALVNAEDMESLLDFNGLDVPAFLSTLGIDPGSFVPTDFVPAGTVVVGHRSAVNFYELPGSPVRVNALDLARGGIDHAVYGYHSELLAKAAGLVKVAWATPETP